MAKRKVVKRKKSPKMSSTRFAVGTRKRGNDGRMYKVKSTGGRKRWVLAKARARTRTKSRINPEVLDYIRAAGLEDLRFQHPNVRKQLLEARMQFQHPAWKKQVLAALAKM